MEGKMDLSEQLVGSKVILKKYPTTFEWAEELLSITKKNYSHLVPWMNWAFFLKEGSVEDEYEFLKMCADDWEAKSHFEFGIYSIETGEFLGGIGLIKLAPSCDKKAEIGYWLTKKACGKGYMQEAVSLIEGFAFDLGYNRIVIRNEVTNLSSKKVALSLGYQFEGVERKGHFCASENEFVDINVFSKLKGE